MSDDFRVRDPVHDFIALNDLEVRIINTPVFQRLRGIRQLALANLVYPGALHTRFDHSLGVCHVAGLMATSLDLSEDDRRFVRLAALLHDLGHGPFSHVSEDALERFAKRDALQAVQKKEKIHELITAKLILEVSDIRDIIGKENCDRVVKLLGDGCGEPILRSIVSGPLDADKQDYLLRDSRFCGVPYGVYDIHQLHECFMLGGKEHERDLWIRGNGVHAVEQYVLAKYYMTTMVYRHQVRLITDQMITRAIVLGVEQDQNETLRSLYEYDGSDEFVNRFIGWDDARFLLTFGPNGEEQRGLCGELLQRLNQRRLLKQVFRCPLKDFADASVKDRLSKLTGSPDGGIRKLIEKGIAGVLPTHTKGLKPRSEFVILNVYGIKSVRTTSRNDEAGIMVEGSGQPRPFEDESTLFKSIDERLADVFVEVYAPVSWQNPAERKALRNRVSDPIRKVIEDTCKEAIKVEA